jgi:outer membrane lipoprotein-sorting protein
LQDMPRPREYATFLLRVGIIERASWLRAGCFHVKNRTSKNLGMGHPPCFFDLGLHEFFGRDWTAMRAYMESGERDWSSRLGAGRSETGRANGASFSGFFLILFVGLGATGTGVSRAQNSAPTTDSVLGMMDKSAQDFRTLTADIEHIKYTDVVKDTSTESGKLYVRRDEKMRIEFTKPDPRTILRNGDNLYVFTPKINRVEEYDLGKNREMVDQYVLLGFGTKSENVRKSYLVTMLGETEFDHKKTVLLELTPKSDQVRKQIAKIQMWIDESSWLPIQQKFFETGSEDYLIFHYTNVMKNLKIGDSQFKQDWPKGVSRTKPRA